MAVTAAHVTRANRERTQQASPANPSPKTIRGTVTPRGLLASTDADPLDSFRHDAFLFES